MTLSDGAHKAADVRQLRSELDRLNRRLHYEKKRTALLATAVKEAVAEAMAGFDLPPIPKPKPEKRVGGEELAILKVSDWQLGKTTPTYNSDICAERVDRLADKVEKLVDVQRSNHPVSRIAVFALGDMIEGELIFPGQTWKIDSSLYRQVTVDGPRILGSLLRRLAATFEQVDVYCVPGNHGFLAGRQRKDMHPESNADRMLYQITSLMLEDDDRISFVIPDEAYWMVADLGEHLRFLLLHGHQVRGWAGIPWYGWTRRLMQYAMMGAKGLAGFDEFDYASAGHFHTPVNLYVNGVRLWINGTTESHNEWAAEELGAAGEPAQWLLFARPGFGVTAEYLIDLS